MRNELYLKNIIGDDRDKPSKSLINFAINYLSEFNFEDKNIDDPEKIIGNDKINSAFIGDLEDAYQKGNWAELKLLMCKIFIVSDRSRAVLDVLVEFAFKILRSMLSLHIIYLEHINFKREEDNWVLYNVCLNSCAWRNPLLFTGHAVSVLMR